MLALFRYCYNFKGDIRGMIVNNLGYIFESRYDSLGSVGVMESFKVLFRGDEQKVSIVLAIDNSGKIIVPAYSDISLGFKPLSNQCLDRQGVDNFVRSNKPYFGKLGEFSMIASGTIVYNKETKEIISTDELFFYVPKTVSNKVTEFIDRKGVQQPAIICDKLSVTKGLNNFEVSQVIYDSYLKNFINCIDAKSAEDRNTFLCSVILKE